MSLVAFLYDWFGLILRHQVKSWYYGWEQYLRLWLQRTLTLHYASESRIQI